MFAGLGTPLPFGNPNKPVYRKNSSLLPKRVVSSFSTWSYLSDQAAGGRHVQVTGSDIMKDLTAWGNRHWLGTATTTITDLYPTRVCIGGVGSTDVAEPVGFQYGDASNGYLPRGMAVFHGTYRYMRVKKVRMTIECRNLGTAVTPLMLGAVVYRNDEAIPQWTLGDDVNRGTNYSSIPNFVRWVHYPSSRDPDVNRSTFKTIEIDVDKLFNDVEFEHDPPEGGSFWKDVTVGGANAWNDLPTLYPLVRIYAKHLHPTEKTSTSAYHQIGVKYDWIVEFDRGNEMGPVETKTTAVGTYTAMVNGNIF